MYMVVSVLKIKLRKRRLYMHVKYFEAHELQWLQNYDADGDGSNVSKGGLPGTGENDEGRNLLAAD